MFVVRFQAEADEEAAEAAEWYERRRAGLGSDFLDELNRARETLSESPHTWPLWQGIPGPLGLRRFLLPRFPYGIAYLTDQREVVVIAVAHLSRKPGYWIGRIGS